MILFAGKHDYLCDSKGLHSAGETICVPMLVLGGLVQKGAKSHAPVAYIQVNGTGTLAARF